MCEQDTDTIAHYDVIAHYDGRMGSFEPKTPQADQWLAEHLPNTARLGRTWAVEDAVFFPLLAEMEEDGFMVERDNNGGTF